MFGDGGEPALLPKKIALHLIFVYVKYSGMIAEIDISFVIIVLWIKSLNRWMFHSDWFFEFFTLQKIAVRLHPVLFFPPAGLTF